jgi:hypothetical protein
MFPEHAVPFRVVEGSHLRGNDLTL